MKSGLCFSLLISFFSFLSSWFVIFEFKLIVPAIHFSYFVIFLEIFRKSAINYSPLPVMFGISLNSFSEFLFSVFYQLQTLPMFFPILKCPILSNVSCKYVSLTNNYRVVDLQQITFSEEIDATDNENLLVRLFFKFYIF